MSVLPIRCYGGEKSKLVEEDKTLSECLNGIKARGGFKFNRGSWVFYKGFIDDQCSQDFKALFFVFYKLLSELKDFI